MNDLSIHVDGAAAAASGDVAAPSTGCGQMRELLLRYHEALRLVETLAASLLDCSQSDADPVTPELARAHRHAAGEALAIVERGEAQLKDLWRALDIDRRRAPATAPLPAALKHDRRKKHRKRSAA